MFQTFQQTPRRRPPARVDTSRCGARLSSNRIASRTQTAHRRSLHKNPDCFAAPSENPPQWHHHPPLPETEAQTAAQPHHRPPSPRPPRPHRRRCHRRCSAHGGQTERLGWRGRRQRRAGEHRGLYPPTGLALRRLASVRLSGKKSSRIAAVHLPRRPSKWRG